MGSGSPAFVRDRFTWLAYGMLAYYAYLQTSLGPVMPFLRDELELSYTAGGLHFSAMALGMVMAGLSVDRVVRRWGRRTTFWTGGAGMAAGALAVALGPHPALTVGGSWIMGYLGTFVMALVQSSLADRHGPRRAVALTEANVGASLVVALCPLLVGGFQRAGIGWQGALIDLRQVARTADHRGQGKVRRQRRARLDDHASQRVVARRFGAQRLDQATGRGTVADDQRSPRRASPA